MGASQHLTHGHYISAGTCPTQVINRTELGRVCDSLSQVALQGAVGGAGVVVRAPRNVTIASYEPQQLEAALKQLGEAVVDS